METKRNVLLRALAVMALATFAAQAELPLETYLIYRAGKQTPAGAELLTPFIGAVGNAYDSANDFLKVQGRPPLFCAPRLPYLNALDYEQIIDTYLKKYPGVKKDRSTSLSVVMLDALQDAYPCAGRK